MRRPLMCLILFMSRGVAGDTNCNLQGLAYLIIIVSQLTLLATTAIACRYILAKISSLEMQVLIRSQQCNHKTDILDHLQLVQNRPLPPAPPSSTASRISDSSWTTAVAEFSEQDYEESHYEIIDIPSSHLHSKPSEKSDEEDSQEIYEYPLFKEMNSMINSMLPPHAVHLVENPLYN